MFTVIQTIFLNNYMLLVAVLGWVAAQALKPFIDYFVTGSFKKERFIGLGGMPSSHSAVVAALMVGAGRSQGFSSPAFAICFVLAMIVMTDAMGVRREAGKQAKTLNQLLESMQENGLEPQNLKEMVGHTPLQVLMGGILGAVIALLIPLF